MLFWIVNTEFIIKVKDENLFESLLIKQWIISKWSWNLLKQ